MIVALAFAGQKKPRAMPGPLSLAGDKNQYLATTGPSQWNL
jgi:hypothetical protein